MMKVQNGCRYYIPACKGRLHITDQRDNRSERVNNFRVYLQYTNEAVGSEAINKIQLIWRI
jgi:hypothetical protein